MRFSLTTALIAFMCGVASYVAATHGDGDLFAVNWRRAAALFAGVAAALCTGASAIRFIVFAGMADDTADRDHQRLEMMRARQDAIEPPSA